MRILVVDDDKKLCAVIKRGLVEAAYAVDIAFDGEDGEYYGESTPYDLIILDVMMPKKSGTEVCKSLRSKQINTPILMLTAKDEIDDIVTGLDAGADDYLVKPFAFSELLARVRALTRRKSETKSTELTIFDLKLDTRTREVHRGNRIINLTTKEYIILEYLMRHPGSVITRTTIEDHAWDENMDNMSNVVDVYIRRLRSKIDVDGEKSLIQTVRGAGYKLRTK